MADRFPAILISKEGEKGQKVETVQLSVDELMEGDVVVDVAHSTVNYKDGLAVTGKSPVVRRWPMVPGIDFAGTVETSSHAGYKAGDKVILNGWGVGEVHYGGYARKARVSGDWLVKLPDGLSTAQAMAIGTAGYTAMLAIMAIEKRGLTPDSGPVVVTGASGGVGSIAVSVLSKLGWHVVASTGRPAEADWLKALGAAEIMDRSELAETPRPLGKERWAAAVDSVGSTTLANLLSQTRYRGAVAACGLAGGMDLPTSVAPFILRGVHLLGIDSVRAPKAEREEAYRRLVGDLDLTKLDGLSSHIGFGEVVQACHDILDGKVRGRLVVDIG